jgi:hypothetical protein
MQPYTTCTFCTHNTIYASFIIIFSVSILSILIFSFLSTVLFVYTFCFFTKCTIVHNDEMQPFEIGLIIFYDAYFLFSYCITILLCFGHSHYLSFFLWYTLQTLPQFFSGPLSLLNGFWKFSSSIESSELSPFNHVSVNDIISKCSYSWEIYRCSTAYSN